MVRANEVDRRPVPPAKSEELRNPFVLRRRRAADSQSLIHLLYRLHRKTVEFEVIRLRACPERFEIGFIPHLEKPHADFVDAVTLDPMPYQLADELGPLGVILGRRHISAVMEYGLAAGRERRGHEAQLDERLHPDREKAVCLLYTSDA